MTCCDAPKKVILEGKPLRPAEWISSTQASVSGCYSFLFMASSPPASPLGLPPSQFVIDAEGLKWRVCAVAAVFNSKNELLIGEFGDGNDSGNDNEIGKSEASRPPQSTLDAAIQKLHAELGLENRKHVLLETEVSPIKCLYKNADAGSGLEKEGFAGQELNWVIFRCCDPDLETDPSLVCNFSTSNGNKSAFSTARWENFDRVLSIMWQKNARPYQVLRQSCAPIMKLWEARCAKINLNGRWSRDSKRCHGVVQNLVARGMPEELALAKASDPCLQHWEQHTTKHEWIVTTFKCEGIPDQKSHYRLGEFAEAATLASPLWGGTDGGTIRRCCFYLAEKDADDHIAHVMLSETKGGKEVSLRYLKKEDLVLKRTFIPAGRADQIVSTEVFSRC